MAEEAAAVVLHVHGSDICAALYFLTQEVSGVVIFVSNFLLIRCEFL